ncbi:MAG: carbohydrate ABC transporter permease [Spirochaetia bacterium]|jgi:multiple sugar transport system permease protein|nr:carbohydrate ABC transporter permease [Spirochaetia bacterium]
MQNHYSKTSTILFRVLVCILLVITLFPIYWIINTSFKGSLEVVSPIPTFFPHKPTLENFTNVLTSGFWGNLLNSLIVTVCATLLSLVLAYCSSYALVRHNFPLKFNLVFLIWILIVKVLPPVVLAIPLYMMLNFFKLINHLSALIIVYQVYTLPYCIWMIFGFLKAVPKEYEEAALIDGASRSYILFRIVMPLVRAGLIATSIFAAITAWDEFLFALLFIRTPAKLTLPLVIVNYIGEYETLWGELMAIGLFTAIPMLLFTNFVYKYYTQGFSMNLK